MISTRARILASGFILALAGTASAQSYPYLPQPQQGVVWQGNVPIPMPYPHMPQRYPLGGMPPQAYPPGMPPQAYMMPSATPPMMMPVGPMMMPNGVPPMMPSAMMPQARVMMPMPQGPAAMQGRPAQAIPSGSTQAQQFTNADAADKKATPAQVAAGTGDCPAAGSCLEPEKACPRRCRHAWFSIDYQTWFIKDGPLPVPLVTTGPITEEAALDDPGTIVLIGNEPIDFGAFTGLRIGTGFWLTDDGTIALEANWFLTERRQTFQQTASDSQGNPQTARPFQNASSGNEVSLRTSFPGQFAGSNVVSASSSLRGWELNLAGPVPDNELRLDWLLGFRSLTLNEDIRVLEVSQVIDGIPLNVGTIPVLFPDSIGVFDRFQAINRFYGPQIGARLGWQRDRLTVTGGTKVAIGWTEQDVRIEGTSSVLPASGAPPTIVPGGVLAQVTNIGSYSRDKVAVVPELSIDLTFQLTSRLQAHVGYTAIFWSNVVRPGDQIDHRLTDFLIPTSEFFGQVTPGPSDAPRFPFSDSDFWAQALNLGLAWNY